MAKPLPRDRAEGGAFLTAEKTSGEGNNTITFADVHRALRVCQMPSPVLSNVILTTASPPSK